MFGVFTRVYATSIDLDMISIVLLLSLLYLWCRRLT
jgi:hypothetical protein